jgi:hypothetical protein
MGNQLKPQAMDREDITDGSFLTGDPDKQIDVGPEFGSGRPASPIHWVCLRVVTFCRKILELLRKQ